MMCSKCDASIPDGSSYCSQCGLSVEAPAVAASEDTLSISPAASIAPDTAEAAAPAYGKKNRRNLLFAGIAAILVVLGVAAFFVIRNFLTSDSNDGFAYTKSPLIIIGEDETQIYNGHTEPVTIDGAAEAPQYSMDGQKAAMLVDRNDERVGTLYYYDGTEAKELTDDVYYFRISADGNTIAYITDYDPEEYTGSLHIYDVSQMKSREVADEVTPVGLALSPDGKSYAYVSDLESDDVPNYNIVKNYTSYISVNGKEAEPLDSDRMVIGISNSATYIYYMRIEWTAAMDAVGRLYVRHGKEESKIGRIDATGTSFFNRDFSEILYSDDGSTYLSKAAGDPMKVGDYYSCDLLFPDDQQSTANCGYNAIMYNVESLTGQFYVFCGNRGGIYGLSLGYLDGKGTLSEIDSIKDSKSSYRTRASCDGIHVYYMDDSDKTLYYWDASDPDTNPVKIQGSEGVLCFKVSSDAIYFIDDDSTLWVKRGNDDPVSVADDVMLSSLTLSSDGRGVYYISDCPTHGNVNSLTLCYLSDAKNAEPLRIADKVSSVEVSDFGVVYYVFEKRGSDDDVKIGEAFYSKDGKNFISVMDDAYFY